MLQPRRPENRPSGTWCAACGKEFWEENRLAIHMRNSDQCQQTLLHHGHRVPKPEPGIGSRKWARRGLEQRTLSVPTKVAKGLETAQGSRWNDTMERAYRDLRDALATSDAPAVETEALEVVRSTLAKYPLYAAEMDVIVDHVKGEIDELRCAQVDDYLEPQQSHPVRSALDFFSVEVWPAPAEQSAEELAGTPLEALPTIQWSRLLQCLRTEDMTRKQLVIVLRDGWEAVRPPPDVEPHSPLAVPFLSAGLSFLHSSN